jgi:hypothetical protein
MKVPKPVGRESSSKMGRMCLKAESVGAEMDMLDWFSFNLTSCQIGRKRESSESQSKWCRLFM